MMRLLCVALLILGFAVPGFGAIYPAVGSTSSPYDFPSYGNFTLVENQTVTTSPISIQTAKNEHTLLTLQISNLQIENAVRIQLKPPGKASTAWLGLDVFQLIAVGPDTSPEVQSFADGMVPLNSGLTVQMDPNFLVIRLTTTSAHPAGTYNYTLSISEGTKSLEVPLRLKVWPFSLPRDLGPTIEANCSYSPSWYSRYGIDEPSLDRIFPSYLAALREYRINAVSGFSDFPHSTNVLVEGHAIEEYPEETRRLDALINTYEFRRFRLPGLSGPYDPASQGADPALFSSVAPGYYQKWYDYLAPKGWADQVLVKIWDEPKSDELPAMIQAYGIVKNAVPAFKTETAGSTPTPEMVGTLDIFTQHFAAYNSDILKPLQDQGMTFWLYANTRHGILFPPTHQRAIGWYLHWFDFSGYLLWGVNRCENDPWTSDQSVEYTRNGTFFYPHPTLGTPIPTLRAEALRRGFEDHLYLDLLKKAQNTVPPADWDQIQARIAALVDNWQIDPNSWAPGDPEKDLPATWSDFESVRTRIGEILSGSATGYHASLWQNGRVADLGTLGGWDSWANAINNQNPPLVVGAGTTGSSPYMHAFAWQSGAMTDLGTLDGDQWSTANGVNDQGWIVGTSGSDDAVQGSKTHACAWIRQDGGTLNLMDLGTLGGQNSYGNAVNNAGQIVGESRTSSGEYHAFLWEKGAMTDLGNFTPLGINDQAQVVGTAPDGPAVLWQNGVLTPLGSLGGDYFAQSANAIAASGGIVGSARGLTDGLNYTRSFLSNGPMTDLGASDGLNSYAQGINSSGQSVRIVGFNAARYPERDYQAFFWQDGRMTDLGVGGAYGLNDQGQAVGYTCPPSGGLIINGGAAATSSEAVQLTVYTTDAENGVTRMQFSNNPGDSSAWSEWQDFSPGPIGWTLIPGEGPKQVAVRFKDSDGLISNTYQNSIVLDTGPPTGGTLIINSGALYTTSSNVIVTVSNVVDASGAASVLLSNDGASFTDVPYGWEESVPWDLNAGLDNPADGRRTVFARIKDKAGYISDFTASASIVLETAPITINQGTGYTNNPIVTITATGADNGGSGLLALLLSNDNVNFTEMTWQDQSSPLTVSWDLNSGVSNPADGLRTVFAKLKDPAGNTGAVSAGIVLDTIKPTRGTIVINNGDQYTSSSDIILTLSCRDANGIARIRLNNDGGPVSEYDYPGGPVPWTLAPGDSGTQKFVCVQFQDPAGNWSDVYSDGIHLDADPPSGQIRIDGISNDPGGFTSSADVTLVLHAVDPGSGVASMRFSQDNSSWSDWEKWPGSPASVPYSLTGSQGTKSVYVQYMDDNGHISDPVSASIVWDATPPSGSAQINGGAPYTKSTAVTLTLSAADVPGSAVRMQFSNDGVTYTAPTDFSTTKHWDLASGDALKTVYVKFTDDVGNFSISTANIILDATAPTVEIGLPSASPTKAGPITYTVAYHYADAVTLTNGNVILNKTGTANGKVAVSGAGTETRTIIISNITGDGTLGISLKAGTATDTAGNNAAGAGPSATFTVDNLGPTVTLSSSVPEHFNSKLVPIQVDIHFTEQVTWAAQTQIRVENGTASGLRLKDSAASSAGARAKKASSRRVLSAAAGELAGQDFTVDITPAGDGAVTVGIGEGGATDAAGNPNTASNQLAWTYDTSAPTVTLKTAAPDPLATKAFRVSITFTEAVTGFELGDITVGNGTSSSFTGSGASYTVSITPTAAGLVTVDVGDGVAQDKAGNQNTQAPQLTRRFNGSAPTIKGARSGQTVNDNKTISPFRTLVIADSDSVQAETVTVTFDSAEKGVFTPASLSTSGFSVSGPGAYTFSGTAGNATTAIRALVFQPTMNRVPPGSTETTTFTVSANDGIYASVTNSQTSVISMSINDPPTLTNLVKSGTRDNDIVFTQADFTGCFSDVDVGAALSKIKVNSLPARGNLFLSGSPVTAGTEIPLANLGSLVFKPKSDWNGSTSFGWNGQDGELYAKTAARVNITITPVNHPPKTSDKEVTVKEDSAGLLITLKATDEDGDALSYEIQTKPQHGTLLTTESANQVIYRPKRDYTGQDSFTFTANDGNADSDPPGKVSITVSPVADTPVADAGPDQKVLPGDKVTLNGGNSTDADGGALTFKWTQASGPTVTLTGASLKKAAFTAPAVGPKGISFVFNLEVTDPTGLGSTDRCIVNVTSTNVPPTSEAGPDRTVQEGASVTLTGSASKDPEGPIASCFWTQTGGPAVILSSRNAVDPTFTAPLAGTSGKSLSFRLTVKDSGGLQSDDVVIVNVAGPTNNPPVANAGPDQEVSEGATIRLDGSGSRDHDDGIASYRWTQVSGPPVQLSNPRAIKPYFTAPNVGLDGADLTFRFIVTDWAGLQSQDSVNIHVD